MDSGKHFADNARYMHNLLQKSNLESFDSMKSTQKQIDISSTLSFSNQSQKCLNLDRSDMLV